jgi:hypothetical protein
MPVAGGGNVFTVDAALERTCADFREQAARGEITAGERDLLTDGAILLAVYLEELIKDARAAEPPSWPVVSWAAREPG